MSSLKFSPAVHEQTAVRVHVFRPLESQPTDEPGERLAAIKPLGRSCRRWQLIVCSWIYEVVCTSTCSDGFATHVETRSPPILRPILLANAILTDKMSFSLLDYFQYPMLFPIPLSLANSGSLIVLFLSLC